MTSAFPRYTLYYMPTCPYCLKVLKFAEKEGIEFDLRNIQDNPQFRQELQEIGGKTQVPCLIINNQPLYESDDIIDRLKKEKSTLP